MDLGALLDAISHLADSWQHLGQAWTDFFAFAHDQAGAVGLAWQQFLDFLRAVVGAAPRLALMLFLAPIGLVAHALIDRFSLGEVGGLLIQLPVGPLQEGWVGEAVGQMKTAAFLLLTPVLGLRALAYTAGYDREDLGALVRDALVTAVVVLTVDQWLLLGATLANGLAAGLGGTGGGALVGAADAQRMAGQAGTLPVLDAGQVQAWPDQVERWLEANAAEGVLALGWVAMSLPALLLAVARVLFFMVFYLLAPLSAVGLQLPWPNSFFGSTVRAASGLLLAQVMAAVLLRLCAVAFLGAILPSQAGSSSAWAVLIGMLADFLVILVYGKTILSAVGSSFGEVRSMLAVMRGR